jgi:hypothetical protein
MCWRVAAATGVGTTGAASSAAMTSGAKNRPGGGVRLDDLRERLSWTQPGAGAFRSGEMTPIV